MTGTGEVEGTLLITGETDGDGGLERRQFEAFAAALMDRYQQHTHPV
jgi:hypothetical protein